MKTSVRACHLSAPDLPKIPHLTEIRSQGPHSGPHTGRSAPLALWPLRTWGTAHPGSFSARRARLSRMLQQAGRALPPACTLAAPSRGRLFLWKTAGLASLTSFSGFAEMSLCCEALPDHLFSFITSILTPPPDTHLVSALFFLLLLTVVTIGHRACFNFEKNHLSLLNKSLTRAGIFVGFVHGLIPIC